MIVYGKNTWQALQSRPEIIKKIYVLSSLKDKELLNQLKKCSCPVSLCDRNQLDQLAKDSHHQGIVFDIKDIPNVDIQHLTKHAQIVVSLDGIQDPHNVGAILRTCECTGVDGLILTKHRSAGLSPSAIKTSAGAAFHVPVSTVNNLSQTIQQLKQEGFWVIGTDMENARDYREGIYDTKLCIVIGSEGKGISPLVKKHCDYMVSIPMVGKTSSLNASVACGVLLYQIYQARNPL